jgi:hypothetical protein
MYLNYFGKAIIALVIETAERTSETSVNIHQTTRRNNPVDRHHHCINTVHVNLQLNWTATIFKNCMYDKNLKL